MNPNVNQTVVIDLGSSKFTALAGQLNSSGKIEIGAYAKVQAKGMKRGMVANIEEVATALTGLIHQIEQQTGNAVTVAHVAYAGQNMKSVDFKGYRFTSEEGIVTKSDLNELFNEAQLVKTEPDFRVLDVIPVAFIVDGENTELNPIGISGRKIEAFFKLILIPEVQYTLLRKVFEKTGVKLAKVVFSLLATAEAMLSHAEKEIGTIILDIGAGTTKMGVYMDRALVHASVIPFGGMVISKDIKEGCSIQLNLAEQLKVQFGEAMGDFADDQKIVTIPAQNGWDPKEISFKSLAYIIQARLEEIIDYTFMPLENSDIKTKLGSGIVVSGGTGDFKNIISLIKFRTGLDARKGNLVNNYIFSSEEIKNLTFSTAIGLLSLMLNTKPVESTQTRVEAPVKKEPKKWSKAFQKIIDFVNDDNQDLPLK